MVRKITIFYVVENPHIKRKLSEHGSRYHYLWSAEGYDWENLPRLRELPMLEDDDKKLYVKYGPNTYIEFPRHVIKDRLEGFQSRHYTIRKIFVKDGVYAYEDPDHLADKQCWLYTFDDGRMFVEEEIWRESTQLLPGMDRIVPKFAKPKLKCLPSTLNKEAC